MMTTGWRLCAADDERRWERGGEALPDDDEADAVFTPSFNQFQEENCYLFSPAYPFYKILAQEISNQRKRIGGDFAIATSIATEVPSKDLRAVIRDSLPESHFIYLNLDEEAQESRFEAMKKHFSPEEIKDGMPKYITSAYKDKSPTENVEENVSVINVTGEMTPKEVMENCLNQI